MPDIITTAVVSEYILNWRPLAKEMAHPIPRVSAHALKKLSSYSWPGNVRELRNVLERALLTLRGDEIRSEDITLENEKPPTGTAEALPAEEWQVRPLDAMINDYVAAAVKATKGNVRKAARLLEISPSTLYSRLKDEDKRGTGARSPTDG